jgi:hypothetical protein
LLREIIALRKPGGDGKKPSTTPIGVETGVMKKRFKTAYFS